MKLVGVDLTRRISKTIYQLYKNRVEWEKHKNKNGPFSPGIFEECFLNIIISCPSIFSLAAAVVFAFSLCRYFYCEPFLCQLLLCKCIFTNNVV